ncbi:hypothetical protein L226DRAFT_488947 [Lentinus tigrinus ALCF2SS1-7]|uniref:Mitochondrial adapter protein MCP1 transmembrane domain-containing protein n=1 Tax=Lentinus tigrinus ALCF2SS1-6 TaxID=1328759 RepID=A0A5C2S6L2_9APHY|nr:hypothetical protein L227DRAFT_168559 [Lentinus tigrinus ALCF2SS1-6]RPD73637.1 hypothetical protein L226DRAFT_488947 [Lentinus tigrinus ALCF2SS1-7]
MSTATPGSEKSFLRRLTVATQPALTKIAYGSAPFITVFALIHLTAPVMANLGGTSLASQVMLLGREYYQTPFGEKYLVLAPLVIHPISATMKRLLAPRVARPITSILSVTGYSAAVVVALHFFTHRIAPSDPAAPIYSVGPSELDYEYVKFALHEWPWRGFVSYIGLTAVVAWHAAEGLSIIWNAWLRPGFGALRQSAQSRAVGAFLSILPVVTGLYFMWQEPLMVFASHAARFKAAFTRSLYF